MQNFSVKGEGNWQEAKIEGRKKGRSITDTIIDGWTKKRANTKMWSGQPYGQKLKLSLCSEYRRVNQSHKQLDCSAL